MRWLSLSVLVLGVVSLAVWVIGVPNLAGEDEWDGIQKEFVDPSLDSTVVAIALADFAKWDDWLGPLEPNQQLILLDEKTRHERYFLSEGQLADGGEHENMRIPSRMRASLRERNARSVPIPDLALSDQFEKTDFGRFADGSFFIWPAVKKEYPNARALVSLFLPGYSKDRKQAVVRFHFDPTPHGATATYMLVKQGGRWTIQWRARAFYA